MKSILRMGAAAIVLLTAAACTQPASRSVAQWAELARASPTIVQIIRPGVGVATSAVLVRALATAPLTEKFIPPCTVSPNATRVIKLRIDNNFVVKQTGRNIITRKVGGAGSKFVKEPPMNPDSTTYDMLLDSKIWDSDDKIIAIKIYIEDGSLMYLGDKYSITTVDGPDSMFICLDRIKYIEDKRDNQPENDFDTINPTWHILKWFIPHHDIPKWDVATVYVDRTKTGSQKFNIRVIVRQDDGAHILPLIIDPKIVNMG